jgi:uncharacterized protein YdgA (DUF945 family)
LKRWPIIALLGVAMLVFLSPGIVGRLAEKNLDENLAWLEEENDTIVITSEQFDRGWFTSEGRHRITIRDDSLFQVLAPDGSSGDKERPSLIIDTRLDHGLVPITSMAREEGSLKPGLASSVSTLHIDSGNGELTDLPGKVYSTIGLAGNTTIRFLMEEGSQTDANALMTWSGADITLTTDPTSRALTAKGRIEPTSIESYGITTNIGTVSFDVEQDRSQYSFGIGTAHVDVDSFTVTSPAQPKAGFGKVSVDVSNELDDGRVNGVASIEFGHVIMPALGDMNLYIDVAAKGLDANSMEVFVSELRAAQAQQPNAPMEVLLPQVEDDLEALLAQGVEIDITRLDVSLPQGDLSTTININIPESGTGSTFSWPGIILATTASVDLRISTSLYELAESMNPDANMLLAMGILKRAGDNYEMEVRYASGLLTINGAPMTIPLGLTQ